MLGLYVPKEKKLTIHFSESDISRVVESSRTGSRVGGVVFGKEDSQVWEYTLEVFNSRKDLTTEGLVVYDSTRRDFGVAIAPVVINDLRKNPNQYRFVTVDCKEVKNVAMRVWTNDRLYNLLREN